MTCEKVNSSAAWADTKANIADRLALEYATMPAPQNMKVCYEEGRATAFRQCSENLRSMRMNELKVKRLDPRAILPTIAHSGSDLGIDLYALEDCMLVDSVIGISPAKVRTGIAVQMEEYGFIIKDRSSVANAGIYTHGGVIDAGYRGEILVMLSSPAASFIHAGQKIAQMIPVRVTPVSIAEVDELSDTARGEKGFGSSGNGVQS